MSVLSDIAFFLIDTLFTLYIALVMIRTLLGASRADFYNPFSQFVVSATNPVLRPLRRIIQPIGRIDTAAIVVMLGLKLVQLALLLFIEGQSPQFLWLLTFSVLQLLELLIYIYMFSIIAEAVLSWINPAGVYGGENPLYSILHSVNMPVIYPLSQVVPRIGMVDITPLVAILLLNIALIVIRAFY